MTIEGLETGKRYFWRRTKSWDWFGQERWWEIDVEIDGLNGGGGLWLTEHWHWNSSDQIIFKQPQTLSYEKSREIVAQIKQNMRVPI